MRELRKIYPVANKEHRCMWCGGIIPAGEKYERATLVYDGDIYDWVNHLDCQRITSLLDMFDDCDDNGLGQEAFCEYLSDYVDWMYPEEEAGEILKDLSDYHSVVQRILADWDTPRVKRKRLESELADCNRHIKYYEKTGCTPQRMEYLKKKKDQLEKELEAIPS